MEVEGLVTVGVGDAGCDTRLLICLDLLSPASNAVFSACAKIITSTGMGDSGGSRMVDGRK